MFNKLKLNHIVSKSEARFSYSYLPNRTMLTVIRKPTKVDGFPKKSHISSCDQSCDQLCDRHMHREITVTVVLKEGAVLMYLWAFELSNYAGYLSFKAAAVTSKRFGSSCSILIHKCTRTDVMPEVQIVAPPH